MYLLHRKRENLQTSMLKEHTNSMQNSIILRQWTKASKLVNSGPIHERAYDRNRAYDGRTPNLRRRGLFTKPVVRTTFVKLS